MKIFNKYLIKVIKEFILLTILKKLKKIYISTKVLAWTRISYILEKSIKLVSILVTLSLTYIRMYFSTIILGIVGDFINKIYES